MDKNSYALGMSIAHNMVSSGIKEVSFDDFMAGLKAVLAGETPAVSFDEAAKLLDKYFAEIEQKQKAEAAALGAAMKKEGEEFLAANAGKEGVVTLPSGLQYKVLKGAEGPKPKATDTVHVHYHGTLLNGHVFDSSVQRGEPISFPLNQVIAGWTEGLQMMSVGSKYRFFIPSDLAYGDQAVGSIPAGSTLVFEVELLGINK